MKNRRAQLKSLNTALQNIRKDEDDDRKKRKEINPTYDGRHHHGTFKKVEVQEDLPANAVGQGGVDMNPTGGPARLKKSPMRRFEPAFDKRHKNKKLLLTKFRQHAYGD